MKFQSRSFSPILFFAITGMTFITSAHAFRLQHSSGNTSDEFGSSVSLSGNFGLVGASNVDQGNSTDQGAVYFYHNIQTPSATVNETAVLKATTGVAFDYFGSAVSISGTTAVVVARGVDSFIANTGEAYLFRNLHLANGTVYEQAILTPTNGTFDYVDSKATSVSLSGNMAIIGASNADNSTTNSPVVQNSGRVYLYTDLDTATGTVNEVATLTASDENQSMRFGVSVSLDGETGLIGAYGATINSSANQGAAYIFRNLGNASGSVNENAKLIASDGGANDYFGASVSLSNNIALVGADFDDVGTNLNQGSAYLFRNINIINGTATEDVVLRASNGSPGAFFGRAVAISGNHALVAAPGHNGKRGMVYIFDELASASGIKNETIRVFNPNGALNDEFGYAISLENNDFIIAEKRGNGSAVDSGVAYKGRISDFTNADFGNDNISLRLSFFSRQDWTIGRNTSNNTLFLTSLQTANITTASKGLIIGRDASANNNNLTLESGSLVHTNFVNIGQNGSFNSLVIQSNAALRTGTIILGENGNGNNLTAATGATINVTTIQFGQNGSNNSFFHGTGITLNVTAVVMDGSSNLYSLTGNTNLGTSNLTVGINGTGNSFVVSQGSSLNSTTILIGQNGNDNRLIVFANSTTNAVTVIVGGNSSSSLNNKITVNGTLNLPGTYLNPGNGSLFIAGSSFLEGKGIIVGGNITLAGRLSPGGNSVGHLSIQNSNMMVNSTWPWIYQLGIGAPTKELSLNATYYNTTDRFNNFGLVEFDSSVNSLVFDFSFTGQPGWYWLINNVGSQMMNQIPIQNISAINLPAGLSVDTFEYDFLADETNVYNDQLLVHIVPEIYSSKLVLAAAIFLSFLRMWKNKKKCLLLRKNI